MITWLTLASCLAVVLLLGAVAVYLVRIARQLEAIGGTPTSYLAKIRFGVRAIEKETALLPPYVTRLNEGLQQLDGGLRAVEADLAAASAKLRGGAG